MSSTSARNTLSELLNDTSIEVRWKAIRTISDKQMFGAIDTLMHISRTDENPLIREEAIWALSTFRDPSIKECLLDVMERELVPQIRCAAIEALSSYAGDEVVSVLISALKDPDCRVQRAAAARSEERR